MCGYITGIKIFNNKITDCKFKVDGKWISYKELLKGSKMSEENKVTRCPECGSTNLEYELDLLNPGDVKFADAEPFYFLSYTCKDCGHYGDAENE